MERLKFLCLVLGAIITQQLFAQKNELNRGLYWELNNHELIISGQGSIPEDVSQKVGYENWREISKVIIMDGITSIGKCAFMAESIESVEIPNTVTQISEKAFYSCSKLKSVSLSNSVSSIGRMAFCLCESLHAIEIPKSVKTIGEAAFCGCGNLCVILPNTQISIGPSAFDGCTIRRTIISTNSDRFYIVSNAGQYGLTNDKGEWIIPYDTYRDIEHLSENYLKVKKVSYGIVSLDGKEIVPPELDAIQQCGKGFFRYKLNGFWGVMNYQGKIIIDTDRGYTSIGDYKSFNKRFAYTMNGYKGECDATGRQISKIKVDTPPQQATASSTTSSSNSSNTGTGAQTIVVEHKHDPVPVQVWKQCQLCGGSGKCQVCANIIWGQGSSRECMACGWSRKCQYCAGNGGHYEVEYR